MPAALSAAGALLPEAPESHNLRPAAPAAAQQSVVPGDEVVGLRCFTEAQNEQVVRVGAGLRGDVLGLMFDGTVDKHLNVFLGYGLRYKQFRCEDSSDLLEEPWADHQLVLLKAELENRFAQPPGCDGSDEDVGVQDDPHRSSSKMSS